MHKISGPVLQIVSVETLDEAIELPSRHQYGNGVAVFTRSGKAAREFASRVNVGMVGVDVPILCRSPTIPLADGSDLLSATPTSMAWKA
jgi:acyl-CoA reductase-like NAD-dependent aldehyde dehydrogenase